MGVIEVLEPKENGSTRVKIDGEWYTAWPPLANKVRAFNVGQSVEFTHTDKEYNGRTFHNLKSIQSNGGGTTSPGSAVAQSVTKPTYPKKDPMEENLMMMVRYALDAMPPGSAKSPKEAVDLVAELTRLTKDQMQASAGRSQSPV